MKESAANYRQKTRLDQPIRVLLPTDAVADQSELTVRQVSESTRPLNDRSVGKPKVGSWPDPEIRQRFRKRPFANSVVSTKDRFSARCRMRTIGQKQSVTVSRTLMFKRLLDSESHRRGILLFGQIGCRVLHRRKGSLLRYLARELSGNELQLTYTALRSINY